MPSVTAREIALYSLPTQPRPRIAGGFWSREGSDLEQEHVSMTAYPVGSRGDVALQVRLASEVRKDEREESKHAVQLEIKTTYEELGAFSRQLAHLAVGRLDEAVLPDPDE